MLAHMNAEALARTLETGDAWYYSRSRNQLWRKARRAEHAKVVGDARRLRSGCHPHPRRAEGSGRHTNRRSCFYRRVEMTADGPCCGFRLSLVGDPPEFPHGKNRQCDAAEQAERRPDKQGDGQPAIALATRQQIGLRNLKNVAKDSAQTKHKTHTEAENAGYGTAHVSPQLAAM